MKFSRTIVALAAVSLLIAGVTGVYAETTAVSVPVVIEAPSWWQDLLRLSTPTIMIVAVAVFGFLGKNLVTLLSQYVPHFIANIISNQYDLATTAGAGWLENKLKELSGVVAPDPVSRAGPIVGGSRPGVAPPAGGGSPIGGPTNPSSTVIPAVTVNHQAVKEAVKYVRASFPDALRKADVHDDNEIANDIIGALGKLAAGAVKTKP